jgi:hypothetical protein
MVAEPPVPTADRPDPVREIAKTREMSIGTGLKMSSARKGRNDDQPDGSI